MRNYPKITVVMPSYNQVDFLESAINSVLSQEYPNLEFILLDGGSDDGSSVIIDRYKDHFTYWQSKPDGGQAAALKAGFEMATGTILCWLNSDDVFLHGAFEFVSTVFDSNPKVDFIYSDRKVIDEQSRCIGEHSWPFFLIKPHWAEGQPLAQECCFWRADLYEKVGGINEKLFFIMDFDLFYRMWRVGRFKKVFKKLGCIRLHEQTKGSQSLDIWKKELSDACLNYNIEKPGYLLARILNRFNSLQFALERLLKRIHIW